MELDGKKYNIAGLVDWETLARDLAKMREIKELEEGIITPKETPNGTKQVRAKRSKPASS